MDSTFNFEQKVSSHNKEEIYKILLDQVHAITLTENDLIANLSNTIALIRVQFDHHWIGFYFAKGPELVLGPFQGPPACTRIPFGKGVCGQSAEKGTTLIVKNVHEFPGHIACSSFSNSEIVIPFLKENKIDFILDIDSKDFNTFDEIDEKHLTQIINMALEHSIL